MKDDSRLVVIVLVILAGGAGAWLWWRQRDTPPPPLPVPVAAHDAAPLAAVDAGADAGVRHPVEAEGERRGLPAVDESDSYVERALVDLLGRDGVRSFLNVEGFVRSFVATVDNLATPFAPARVWPAQRTPSAFKATSGEGGLVIAAENAERYAPFVRFVEKVDTKKAVRLYRRLYPLFQTAYEDLGYPGRYFNDRVVEVIDHLLATPTPSGPVRVKRFSASPDTPDVYVFEDPELEKLSAGRKILLRMGAANAEALKRKLAAVRSEIAKQR